MNKKGFTLIELLAVIVILAIIALIATPIVLDIINDTKKSAQLRGAEFYLDAIEQSITNEMMNNSSLSAKECKIQENGNLLCSELGFNECRANLTDGSIECGSDEKFLTEIEVKVSGEKPTEGIIKLNKGNVSDAKLTINNNSMILKDNSIVFEDDTSVIYESDVVRGEKVEIPESFKSNVIYNITFTNPTDNTVIQQRGIISESNGNKLLVLESYLGNMTSIPLIISSSSHTGHLKIEELNKLVDYSLRINKNNNIYFYSKDFELGAVNFYFQIEDQKYSLNDSKGTQLQFSYKFGDYVVIGFEPAVFELYPAIGETYENIYIIVEQEIDGKKIIRKYGGTKPIYQETHAYSEVNDSYYWGSDFMPFLGD